MEVDLHNPSLNPYSCEADTSILGTADVPLSNGQLSDTGYTKLECQEECSSAEKCASYAFYTSDGYCELWSTNTGATEDIGGTFCTKPGSYAPLPLPLLTPPLRLTPIYTTPVTPPPL